MGWYGYDVYGQPEKFGLEILFEADRGTQCYEFDMFVAFKQATTGGLFYGVDSGCSCPSPFEQYRSVDDLDGPVTAEALAAAALQWAGECWTGRTGDRVEFVQKVNAWRVNESRPVYAEAA